MSALIEKIRQETRLGNFAKVKRILSTNYRHFASLPKAEQNVLLLAMINIQEPRLLFKNLGHELDEKSILKFGPDEFKHQIIIALAHMWFGSEALALRIARRLEQILIKKQMHFEIADQKRIIETISAIFDAQERSDLVIHLKKIYPSKQIPGTEHTDNYFYRKYYLALFNEKGGSKKIANKIEEIKNKTQEPIAKIFLFCDLCIIRKLLGDLSSTEIVELIKKEKILKHVTEKNLKIPWIHLVFAQAEIEKKNFPRAKKYLIHFYQQCKLPADKIYALTLFHYHFPSQISLAESVYLWSYYGTRIQTFINFTNDPYFPLIKKHIAKGDCWHISANSIVPCHYNKIQEVKNLIDLNAGIIFIDSKPHILTEKRVYFLIQLISKGSFGCTEIDLITEIYPNILSHHTFNKKDSLKNLSLQFLKIGIHIKKVKEFYFYDFSKNSFDIILPISQKSSGLHIYCAKKVEQFNYSAIAKLLKIKRTKAFGLIKKWRENKIIKQLPSKSFIFPK